MLSLRSSERGLKFHFLSPSGGALCVAPFVGAWIEIPLSSIIYIFIMSLRSSERGLKLHNAQLINESLGRSVRRSVD